MRSLVRGGTYKEMRNQFKNFSAAKTLACSLFVLVFAGSLFGQTYTTIANGNWSSPATWQGGSVPPTAVDLPVGATINVRHTVAYDTGNNLRNRGEIRIQPVAGTTATLNVPSGITIETFTGGRFYIINASLIQCRFAPCNDGQPYNGNQPGAQQNTGTFRNSGGLVEVRSSIVEIAKFWINFSGIDIIVDSCITLGETFAIKGTAGAFSNETISRSYVSMGWHGPGQFELANGTVTFQEARFQLAGAQNSGFNLQFGTANGDIDYITVRNHIVPFISNAVIFASQSLNTSGLNLDAFCLSNIINYQHNNKFSGTQTQNCALNVFPANCSVLTPSAAGASIEGRVSTVNGTGISRAVVEITGGQLSQPMRVLTNGFGFFKFEDIEVGHTYIVSVSAKRYTFAEPSRVVSLVDNLGDIDFVAEGQNNRAEKDPQHQKK